MKKLIITLIVAAALVAVPAFAGSEYSPKDTVKSDSISSFYNKGFEADIFGTYRPRGTAVWGGGVDGKYFFTRNFGLGVEGYAQSTHKTSGAALGTITARLPLGQVAPYVFGGYGATGTDCHDIRGVGQLGAGVEYRFTPRFGVMADYSRNFINSAGHDDMVRGGINFAF